MGVTHRGYGSVAYGEYIERGGMGVTPLRASMRQRGKRTLAMASGVILRFLLLRRSQLRDTDCLMMF